MIIKVVGVTFKNKELGVNRQDIIKKLCGKEQIFLHRETKNRFDPNAVAVMLRRGKGNSEKLGYIRAELAYFMSEMWNDFKFKAYIHEIRQGDDRLDKPWGLSIKVEKVRRKVNGSGGKRKFNESIRREKGKSKFQRFRSPSEL